MIALIPARSGSKRLPRKNLLPFGGIPLIGHTILQALGCSSVSEVVVSTDCPEIANIAQEYGACIPFLRPPHLASDTASSLAVFQHFVEYSQEQGSQLQSLLVLQPTSPLRKMGDIEESIKLFGSERADSVISCVALAPQSWMCRVDTVGRLFKAFHEDSLEQLLIPNGSIYVLTTDLIRKGIGLYTDLTFAHVMPRSRSIDIDTIEDFQIAEALWVADRGVCRGT